MSLNKKLGGTYNWAAAFCAYAKGAPLEEVATIFGIPYEAVRQRAWQEEWTHVATQMPVAEQRALASDESAFDKMAVQGKMVEAKLRLIEENRAKNLAIAQALRDDLVDVIGKLRSAEGLMVEKHWHNKGLVTTAKVPASIADRVALASYASQIASLTYTALGDKVASDGRQDAPAGTPHPSITVILPGAISNPRASRDDSQVIDLRDPIRRPDPSQPLALDASTDTQVVEPQR